MAALCLVHCPTHCSIPIGASEKDNLGHDIRRCSRLSHVKSECSVYREVHRRSAHMQISRIRPVDQGFKTNLIGRVVNQLGPVNLGSGIEVSKETLEFGSTDSVKVALKNSLEGLNRGIFGVPAAKRTEIERLLKLLEGKNPVPNPTENLEMVNGQWRLLYSTISILGSKRTKLGLRDFITLGDFVQTIDVKEGKAKNAIGFTVSGLGMLAGELTIEASFKTASPKRVDIQFEKSAIVPEKLLNLFRKNYDLLLRIFNPEGWLETTFVDDNTRIGRDDKGNIFLLERVAGQGDLEGKK